MKKIFLLCLFACAVGTCINAYASDYIETETINTYEKISIDTVKYYDGAYIAKPKLKPAPKPAVHSEPCRFATSLEVARNNCDCAKPAPSKLAPVRVKTYTEVIEHYQVYEPVVTYKPAGTYTTRRYIEPCNKCAR